MADQSWSASPQPGGSPDTRIMGMGETANQGEEACISASQQEVSENLPGMIALSVLVMATTRKHFACSLLTGNFSYVGFR
jgi:hypothetical protein